MSSHAKGSSWSGDPLPRGRHKLAPAAVKASQRERLLRAMGELAAERGFAATTVPQVVAAARVSSNTFYAFFADKTDCFIALCEELGDELFAALSPPQPPTDVPDALDLLERGIRTYLRWWQDRPALARAYFLELPAVGTRAVEERDRQYERFAALHRDIATAARLVYPDAPDLRDADVNAAVIVVTELTARELRLGHIERLADLEDDLRYLLVKLLVGEQAADFAERKAHSRRAPD